MLLYSGYGDILVLGVADKNIAMITLANSK